MEAPPAFLTSSLGEYPQPQQMIMNNTDPLNSIIFNQISTNASTNNSLNSMPNHFMANYAPHIYSMNLPIPNGGQQNLATFGIEEHGFQQNLVKIGEGGQFGGNGNQQQGQNAGEGDGQFMSQQQQNDGHNQFNKNIMNVGSDEEEDENEDEVDDEEEEWQNDEEENIDDDIGGGNGGEEFGRKHGVDMVKSTTNVANGVDLGHSSAPHLLLASQIGHSLLHPPSSISHQQPILIPPSNQQPISVIVHPNITNQQQSSSSQKPMEKNEWNDPIIGNNSSLSICDQNNSLQTGHQQLIIRDDFIFSQNTNCASPPSSANMGGGPTNDFLYDHNLPIGVANSILEDSFLTSMQQNSSLLDIPCTSSSGSTSLTGFLDLHHQQKQRHRRDGSVGISPCSSSTQISASSPDDSIFVPPINHPQPHFINNRPFPEANCLFSSPFSLPINGQSKYQNFPMFQPKMHQSREIFEEQHLGDVCEEEEIEEEGGGNAKNEEGRETIMMMGGGDEDFDDEERDVKPSIRLIQRQSSMKQQMVGQGNNGKYDDDFALSPPPPPLTPPSKTRSKMHDLALKHRLISNQNLRSQGFIYLSSEEKKTLVQEGFPIPTKLPLMREEEEALKIVRRKIKNKLSAQESRRKRKEYMDMLEKRVHSYFADNTALRQRIRQLEATNQYLMTQIQQKPSSSGKGGCNPQENNGK